MQAEQVLAGFGCIQGSLCVIHSLKEPYTQIKFELLLRDWWGLLWEYIYFFCLTVFSWRRKKSWEDSFCFSPLCFAQFEQYLAARRTKLNCSAGWRVVAGRVVSGVTVAEMWIDGFLRCWQLPVGQCIPASQPCQLPDHRQGLTGGSEVGRFALRVCIVSLQHRRHCKQHYQGR